MDCLDNLRIVRLQFSDVCDTGLMIFHDFLQNHIQELTIYRKSRVKSMLSFLNGLNHDDCDLINKVYFRNQHFGDPWPDNRPVFEIHVISH